MTTPQKLGAILAGLFFGGWIGRAILHWIAGLDGAALNVGLVVFALAGAAIALAASAEDQRAAKR